MARAFGMNPKVGGSSPPSGRDIFCLENFDTFTRTAVHVSKMNAVARAQLSFQMLILLQKYLLTKQNESAYILFSSFPRDPCPYRYIICKLFTLIYLCCNLWMHLSDRLDIL